MACKVHKTPEGNTIIFCTSRRRSMCRFCGERVATKQCDYPLGQGKTCNAYICDRCAAHVGLDTDYCPKHRGMTQQGELFGGDNAA